MEIISDGGQSLPDAGFDAGQAGPTNIDAGPAITDSGPMSMDAGAHDAGPEPQPPDTGTPALDAEVVEPPCESGYERRDSRCSDIDECVSGAHDCDTTPNACVNVPGSFSCACPNGYDGNGRGGRGCIDRDDCANDPCGSGASGCTDNGPNSYVCTCRQGYTGAGTQGCADINECAQSVSCNTEYRCINRAPGYTCLGQFADWRMPDYEAGSLTSPSYSASPDGRTIRDNVTRLVWEAEPPLTNPSCKDGNVCTWHEAVNYCDTLPLAGQNDWRLPTKIELESILDHTHTNPAASPIFGEYTSFFWTAQNNPNSRDSSWLVDFTYGETVTFGNDNKWHVRCVRAGE